MADEVILLDIYPARELPMEGITSETITGRMSNPAHTILTKEGLLEYVKLAPLDLLITAGAGDIDKLTAPIKEILENR
jgi:UDP-N-acetylmuramate--alanine ligase